MIDFLTSVEGIAMLVLIGAVIAGGINEWVYFNNICKSLQKSCERLQEDIYAESKRK